MIEEIIFDYKNELMEFIKLDNARNYFIRLGLESEKDVFEKVYGYWNDEKRLTAALFKRVSGNLQFFAKDDFDADGFAEILRNLEYEYLISPESYCDVFLGRGLFELEREGAYIAKLEKSSWIENRSQSETGQLKNSVDTVEPERTKNSEKPNKQLGNIKKMTTTDIGEIAELYEEVFNSFSSDAVMRKKLETGRGRGVCIRAGNRILSVAQSEFENSNSAIIVGVATEKSHQGEGLATKCLESLISELIDEGKDLYLQYDNPQAGEIYKKLGFIDIDRVKHYKKKR